MHDTSVTGIPVEYLFTIIGALLMLVYADIKRELKALRSSAAKRDVAVAKLTTAFRYVCKRLNLPFIDDNHDNGD